MTAMFPAPLIDRAERLLEEMRRRNWRLATAESCTGGLIAACLTEIPGSSDVVERGFITYSNEAKVELLGVPDRLIRTQGAVSHGVAAAMAAGALARASADVAVSATGVSGPGGGTPDKPVGVVYIGLVGDGFDPTARRYQFEGDRTAVRLATVDAAMAAIMQLLGAE
jgi:nicotinamide-nucleotide amidase